MSIAPKQTVKTKTNEYGSIIWFNKFETIATKEIDCIKKESSAGKVNLKNENSNKDKYKHDILRKSVVSPSNDIAIQSLDFNAISFKIMKYNACKLLRTVHMSNTESPFCGQPQLKAQDVGQVLYLNILIYAKKQQ